MEGSSCSHGKAGWSTFGTTHKATPLEIVRNSVCSRASKNSNARLLSEDPTFERTGLDGTMDYRYESRSAEATTDIVAKIRPGWRCFDGWWVHNLGSENLAGNWGHQSVEKKELSGMVKVIIMHNTRIVRKSFGSFCILMPHFITSKHSSISVSTHFTVI